MELNNFNNFNIQDNNKDDKKEDQLIDIYIKQRNGRKSIIKINGLGNNKSNLKNLVKILNKKMSCSGSVSKDKETGEYIVIFTGKNTDIIISYLKSLKDYENHEIKLHGGIN